MSSGQNRPTDNQAPKRRTVSPYMPPALPVSPQPRYVPLGQVGGGVVGRDSPGKPAALAATPRRAVSTYTIHCHIRSLLRRMGCSVQHCVRETSGKVAALCGRTIPVVQRSAELATVNLKRLRTSLWTSPRTHYQKCCPSSRHHSPVPSASPCPLRTGYGSTAQERSTTRSSTMTFTSRHYSQQTVAVCISHAFV